MTPADIERMAREAGLMQYNNRDWYSEQTDGISAGDLAHFAALVQAAARERCAAQLDAPGCDHCAAAIRGIG